MRHDRPIEKGTGSCELTEKQQRSRALGEGTHHQRDRQKGLLWTLRFITSMNRADAHIV